MTIPNLSGVITLDDVHKKGTGSFQASYVAWSKTAQLLHQHAPGFDYHLRPNADGELIHKAPDGTGFVVGYFTGPDGIVTADFPFPCMDHRNNPIAYDKISARVLTDSHRRSLAACACFAFSLAHELWSKEEVQSAANETMPSGDAPAAQPSKQKPAVQQSQPQSAVLGKTAIAGLKVIRGTSSLKELKDVGARLTDRHKKGDLNDTEHQELMQALLEKETQLAK